MQDKKRNMFISMLPYVIFIGLLKANSVSPPSQGFQPCGSDEHLQFDLSLDAEMQQRMDAIEEHWRRNPNYGGHQVDLHRRLQSLPSPLIIPINFIITKGPSDPYIGYEQIISQIRVLNEDFQGLNSDKGQNGHGSISEFAHLAGDFNIRFSLNKIKRRDTTVQYFTGNDMKFDSSGGQDNEDPQHALNFWVNSIDDGILGFATFPGGAWNLDGIVQAFEAVGSADYDRNNQWSLYSNYNLGRTASHEIGHWLHLHHIWGDGDCSYDDHVADTPVDDGPNYGCAANGTSSCGSNDMYMNFMDYSHDHCLNMFTIGQVDRSDDLFLAGGWREKLLDYTSNPTDIQFVDYFYFVNGNGTQCDVGHTRRDLDINDGAGGDYIYLCISYSNNPYVDVITDIDIISGDSTSISCNPGYEKIDSDLNEDAGGDHIYVCYKKESQQIATTVITDFYPFYFWIEQTSSSYNGYTLELSDLNKNAGGYYIYLGFKKRDIDVLKNYFKGPTALNYADAASYCESEGSTLASIETELDWNDAKFVCGSDNCFIGLRDDINGNADMIWSWDDGTDITNSYGFNTNKTATKGQGPWNNGEPNEWQGTNEDCVTMVANTGKYNDIPCTGYDYYPLCNKAPQAKYIKGPDIGNYDNAVAYCQSQGTTLASIGTESDFNDAKSICGPNRCIIGLRDVTEGQWLWDDGLDITNSFGFNSDGNPTTGPLPWYPGEPNNHGGNEDCVEISEPFGGLYNDVPCHLILYYPLCNKGNQGNQGSGAAKSVYLDDLSDPDEVNNKYNYEQYPNNDGHVMNRYYGQDNYNYNYKQYPENNNGLNSIDTNSTLLWITIGLMILNIICLIIYCMDNNKNKKEKGFKLVKYESEDSQLL